MSQFVTELGSYYWVSVVSGTCFLSCHLPSFHCLLGTRILKMFSGATFAEFSIFLDYLLGLIIVLSFWATISEVFRIEFIVDCV